MKYKTLLKQATPLPLKRLGVHIFADGKKGANVASASSPRQRTDVGYSEFVLNKDAREAFANAKLLCHSANVLPKALEALKSVEREIDSLVPNHRHNDSECLHCALKRRIRDAIAEIENVKE